MSEFDTAPQGGTPQPDGARIAAEPELPGDIILAGLVRGTLVATVDGWRPVEKIRPRDTVLTLGTGARQVAEIEHVTRPRPEATRPSLPCPRDIPAGVLGNRAPIPVMPEQWVLVEADEAARLFGSPFVVVQARALDGWRGIGPVDPGPTTDIVVLRFEEEETVYCAGGALLHCPATRPEAGKEQATIRGLFPHLTREDLSALLARMDETGAGTWPGDQAAFASGEKRP